MRRPRVLVIDNDVDVRVTVARILEYESHDVRTAEDGARGLKLFAAEPPDLVITELLMPGKDGLELIIEMRRRRPDALIIALSGGGQIGNIGYLEVATLLGATAALAKPFEVHEFVALVRSVLKIGRHTAARAAVDAIMGAPVYCPA